MAFALKEAPHLVGGAAGPGNGFSGPEHPLVPAVGSTTASHSLRGSALGPPSFSGRPVLGLPMGLTPCFEGGVFFLFALLLELDLNLSLSLGILGTVTLRLRCPNGQQAKAHNAPPLPQTAGHLQSGSTTNRVHDVGIFVGSSSGTPSRARM